MECRKCVLFLSTRGNQRDLDIGANKSYLRLLMSVLKKFPGVVEVGLLSESLGGGFFFFNLFMLKIFFYFLE